MGAQVAGAELFPVDIGIASDVPGLTRAEYKIARGTGNMARDPAMPREQAEQAVRSVVATLCALEGVSAVQIKIYNAQFTSVDLSEPLTVGEDWILP